MLLLKSITIEKHNITYKNIIQILFSYSLIHKLNDSIPKFISCYNDKKFKVNVVIILIHLFKDSQVF